MPATASSCQSSRLAEKVETVHAGTSEMPAGLAALLRVMIGHMEIHMKKEEPILFPAIRQGGRPGIDQPIAAMRADHDDHAAEVARIRELSGGLTLPEGACRKWSALYEGVGRLSRISSSTFGSKTTCCSRTSGAAPEDRSDAKSLNGGSHDPQDPSLRIPRGLARSRGRLAAGGRVRAVLAAEPDHRKRPRRGSTLPSRSPAAV